MKLKLNRDYVTIAAYALMVIAFVLLFISLVINMEACFSFVGNFFSKISCLFFGVFFTFCFLPLVRAVEVVLSKLINRKKEHPLALALIATIVIDLMFLAVVALGVINIIPAVIDGYEAFRRDVLPQVAEITQRVNETDSTLLIYIYNTVYNLIAGLFRSEGDSLVTTITAWGTIVVSRAYDIVVGLVLSSYFLVCRRYLYRVANKLFTAYLPSRFRGATFAVAKRIYSFFVEFFCYHLMAGIVMAVLVFVLFIPFGIPYGIIIAVMVFIGNFIPVFGPIVVTMGSTLLIAIFSPSDARLWQTLAVLIILSSIHILIALLVKPFCLRKKLRPGPGTTVTCIIIFYALLGFGGVIFAVPLYTSIDVAYREILARRLAKKKMPQANAYYATLKELPSPKKELEDTIPAPLSE